MFFAILLLLTKNKTIYTFVLFTGVAGGIISLLTPVMGYNSLYYRYYQFMGAHILLILTPLYFLVTQEYIPSKKATIYSFIILQSIGIFMMVFNYIFYTDFMFLLFDPSKLSKFPIIAYFGGIPHYLIWVELAAISYFIAGYYGIQSIATKTKMIPQT